MKYTMLILVAMAAGAYLHWAARSQHGSEPGERATPEAAEAEPIHHEAALSQQDQEPVECAAISAECVTMFEAMTVGAGVRWETLSYHCPHLELGPPDEDRRREIIEPNRY